MACSLARKYPLKKGPEYKPPVPRWMLKFDSAIAKIFVAYLGVQQHDSTSIVNKAYGQARTAVKAWIDAPESQITWYERFNVEDGFDIASSDVWVCYWADETAFKQSFKRLQLAEMYQELGSGHEGVGLWCESFTTPVERVETNYARLEHVPGLANLPGTEQVEHNLSAYWGAGRDRIPAAANDLFEQASALDSTPPDSIPSGIGQRLTGANYANMTHIRSGQYWETCPTPEREAYETILEPTLLKGLSYLWENPHESGTLGLRFLRNVDHNTAGKQLETCGAGFFRTLGDLEIWAKRHKSHLAIFNGAIAHAKEFGPDRKFMTWHEVCVLKEGEGQFEYLNCAPNTGVIRFVKLQAEPL